MTCPNCLSWEISTLQRCLLWVIERGVRGELSQQQAVTRQALNRRDEQRLQWAANLWPGLLQLQERVEGIASSTVAQILGKSKIKLSYTVFVLFLFNNISNTDYCKVNVLSKITVPELNDFEIFDQLLHFELFFQQPQLETPHKLLLVDTHYNCDSYPSLPKRYNGPHCLSVCILVQSYIIYINKKKVNGRCFVF